MTTIDRLAYRRAIGTFATGVTVITVATPDGVHGMTANSLTSVSLDPLLLLVCIDRRAQMAQHIQQAGRFAVNVLSSDQEWISRHFAGRPGERAVPFGLLDGLPVIGDALAQMACTITQVLDGGDHSIVMGEIVALAHGPDLPPLLYFGGRYRELAPDTTQQDPWVDFFIHHPTPFAG